LVGGKRVRARRGVEGGVVRCMEEEKVERRVEVFSDMVWRSESLHGF